MLSEHFTHRGNYGGGANICYQRVSTQRQGKSGLGLEAQRNSVAEFLNGGNWTLVKEFVEVESGKKADNRPELAKAIQACRAYGAKLLIAKLDRLSRDAHFLLGLEKAGIDFVAADMPNANSPSASWPWSPKKSGA
jgi:DNA invertase Pin-like site-specific DNA recombinase